MTLVKLIDFVGGAKNYLLKVAVASSVCLGTVSIMFTPVQVKAASITILNPSFESPTAPLQPSNQFYTINNVTTWQISGSDNVGVFNPSASTNNTGINYFNQTVPDGVQTAYLDNNTAIFQQLTATLQTNTQYTLSLFIGRRTDRNFLGYNVELLAGNTVLASNNSVLPAIGTFAPLTVNYTSGINNILVGQALGIRLSSNGDQVNFDNVTLDANTNAVPEPSSILELLAFGILGIGTQIKRKPNP